MLRSTRRTLLAGVVGIGAAGLGVAPAAAQASRPNEIVGVWETETRNLRFEMFDAGGVYAARVLHGDRLMAPDGKTWLKDTKNPDPNLRGRSLQGILFVQNLKWDAANRNWSGGKIYDGSRGRTADVRVTLVGEKMELRAFLGTPALGQTIVLRRAS